MERHGYKMKVCLVRPQSVNSLTGVGQDASLPIGLAYLAGSVAAAGYSLQVVDAVGEAISQYMLKDIGRKIILHGLASSQIIDRIDKDADIIGVSCMFSNSWLTDRELIEEIHKAFPAAVIVIGGEHATALPEYILETCSAIQIVILGEGEETFVQLIHAIDVGIDLETIDGIAYRNDKGLIVKNRRRARISDINTIPKPGWDYFNVENYISHAFTHGVNLGRSMSMLMTRGCPHNCAFCSCPDMWTNQWRPRKPELVIEEMKEYIAKYNVTNFDFYDLSAIINREWIIEFCNLLISEELNITWQLPSGVRSELIDAKLAKLIYESGGIRAVSYAPETGSQKEQIRLKKNVSINSIIKSMKSSCSAGLHIKANLIFGFPGQTWSDIVRTALFVIRLAWIGMIEIAPFPYSPYPGSSIFNKLREDKKVELNDQYFLSLLSINDPVQTISYSNRFSSKTIKAIILFMLCEFYFFSFLFRPKRFFILLYQIITNDSSTRITYSLANVRRRWVILKMINKRENVTVNIPHIIYPSSKKIYKDKQVR
ncbi:MAG: Radical domain protein [Herbinix sp.]|jgi:radical SAM superfamily enzyme YgiQ (UPF0313 family)|nr:Radical domain protein [Herbinix sp.]